MTSLTDYFKARSTTKAAAAPATVAAPMDRVELAYASAWGIPYSVWMLSLTAEQRKDYRDRVAYAPYISTEGK